MIIPPWGCLAAICLALLSIVRTPCLTADESAPTLLFTGGDEILVSDDSGLNRKVTGRIEDLVGETLTIRRSSDGRAQFLQVADVSRIGFSRPAAWAIGQKNLDEKNVRRALEYFDKAIRDEPRQWAKNELLAHVATVCVEQGLRSQAVKSIERVHKSDPLTRHVALLPLVWDSRLPNLEKIDADPQGMTSASEITRLVSSSVFLHERRHQATAEATLRKLRRNSHNLRLGRMAETQLWRLRMLNTDSKHSIPAFWFDVVEQLPPAARGGPSFVLGRVQALEHNYDGAALSFLWMPLMQPCDRSLTAASLYEAIICLKKAGRLEEADQMTTELTRDYPDSSAAKKLKPAEPFEIQ